MSLVHFDRAGVQRLLDHAKAAPDHQRTYGQTESPGPCLLLVGDCGIYLMSNGIPHLRKTPEVVPVSEIPHLTTPLTSEAHSFVVYARECDPTVDKDGWYDAKREIFGGDDGAENLPVAAIEKALVTYSPDEALIVDIQPTSIGVLEYQREPTPKRRPRR